MPDEPDVTEMSDREWSDYNAGRDVDPWSMALRRAYVKGLVRGIHRGFWQGLAGLGIGSILTWVLSTLSG